ncbi:alpha/beta fold hydrolase [Georgenia subflava]|uniref:Alpha/beta fold hydrolase n=1 Tax=Georgenia subflava TaxID=1622177 RepID=A0A6N7ECL1_9MICO|nr:alpha/beta hydrolase [Georgenia subflava]MPV35710.1 alpha/beta fold hydrolase [Georgenia subflava]
MIDGKERTIESADGTPIWTVSAGAGPPLLLVHGGMTSSTRWHHLWQFLTLHHAVSAMDRRGRGRSGDGDQYSLTSELQDVAVVARDLAERHGGPVDAFGHSIGAVCVLGAAAAGAPFRRIALYEPPGPETVPRQWVERATAMVAGGQPGRAMASFLIEVIGLSPQTVAAMRDTSVAADALEVVAATLPREAEALTAVDLDRIADSVPQPVLLLLGGDSPGWAGTITERLTGTLSDSTVVTLDGVGHEGVDTAPQRVAAELTTFFSG